MKHFAKASAVTVAALGLGAIYAKLGMFLTLGGSWWAAVFYAPKGLMYYGWPLLGGCFAMAKYFRQAYWAAAAMSLLHILGVTEFILQGPFSWGDLPNEWRGREWLPFAATAYYGVGLGICATMLLRLKRQWKTPKGPRDVPTAGAGGEESGQSSVSPKH
jgi:hypothetical protein